MPSVIYGTKSIEFKIVRKAKMKNTYIQVDRDGVVVKTNKQTTTQEIEKMVNNKLAWINKKLELFKSIAVNRDITTGSRLYYMGKSYYVNMIKDKEIKTIIVNFSYSKFHITTPLKFTKVELDKAIEKFYKQKAIEKIIPLTIKLAKIMEVTPQQISFRVSKTRWGSCNYKNCISFNYHLVKLSSSLIEYVIIHELSHIVHKNHSKDFWQFVNRYLPDYKIKEDKIRDFEKLI